MKKLTNMPKLMTLGSKLHYLRRKAKLSQQEVADLTERIDPTGEGVSQSVYCRYENDKKPEIDPEDVRLLAKVFEVDYEYLMETIDPLIYYSDEVKAFISSREAVPLIINLYKQYMTEKLSKL